MIFRLPIFPDVFSSGEKLTWKAHLSGHLETRSEILENFLITGNNYSGSESIAHEAEGQMGYWLRDHEGERNNCFSKIQLVGQKYWEEKILS